MEKDIGAKNSPPMPITLGDYFYLLGVSIILTPLMVRVVPLNCKYKLDTPR